MTTGEVIAARLNDEEERQYAVWFNVAHARVYRLFKECGHDYASNLAQEACKIVWREFLRTRELPSVSKAVSIARRKAGFDGTDRSRHEGVRRRAKLMVRDIYRTSEAPFDAALAQEVRGEVERAIDELTPRQQPVIRAHLAGEEDNHLIARAQGLSTGQVRRHIREGLARLQDKLRGYREDGRRGPEEES